MATRQRTVPATAETKNEVFRRLAKKRVTRASHAISLVGNLASKGSYEYSHTEARSVVKRLEEAVETVRLAFQPKPGTRAFDFGDGDPDKGPEEDVPF